MNTQTQNDIKKEYEEINKSYKDEMFEINERLRIINDDYNLKLEKLRKKCPHVSTTYYPDPSGNNDSYYECDDCGKESKNLDFHRFNM